MIHFYALLRFEPLDPASEDIPMCHRVSLPNSKVCSYNKPQRKSELLYKKVYYFFDKVPFDLKVYKDTITKFFVNQTFTNCKKNNVAFAKFWDDKAIKNVLY